MTGTRRASRCATGRLDRSIYSYTSGCYYEIVYIQGGNLLNQVRSRMGSTPFWSTLKQYVADRRYRISNTQTLLKTLDDATPPALSTQFTPRVPAFYSGPPVTRRSAASACGICRNVGGRTGFQARQPATSQRDTLRSSGPQDRP